MAEDTQSGSMSNDGVACPNCGRRLSSRYARGCIHCGWREAGRRAQPQPTMPGPAQDVARETTTEAGAVRSVPSRVAFGRRRWVIAAGVVLLLLVMGVAGFHGYRRLTAAQAEARQRRIQEQYIQLLEQGKGCVLSRRLKAAAECLKKAAALPETVDKSEALALLAEIETAEIPVEKRLRGMSDADLLALCQTGALPPGYRLTYAPLNAQYQEKALLWGHQERARRQENAEAERKRIANRGQVEGDREAQEKKKAPAGDGRKAEGTERPAKPPATVSPSAPAGAADKIMLVKGASVAGRITDCQGGEVRMSLTVVAGDQTQTLQRRYNCSDITHIEFAVPDAALQKKIVKGALVVGNGVLAYGMACAMNDDPSMKSLSDNHGFAVAVADFRAAKSAYDRLASQLTDAETRAAELDRRVQAQQDRLSGERTAIQKRLSDLRSKRDAASAACEKAQTTLKSLCRDVLQNVFPRQAAEN